MTTIELAYRRFSRKRFPLPTETQVLALEQRIQVTFPDDYRDFLLKYNGGYFTEPEIRPVSEGCPQEALTFMHGLTASHNEAELGRQSDLSLFDNNFPPEIVPIGCTPLGSLIILDTAPVEERGAIYFKQAFGDFYYLADGIEEFFGLLREPTWAEQDSST
jgi:hypothetical protein